MTSLPLAPRWRLRESAANRHPACGATDGLSAWQRSEWLNVPALIGVQDVKGHPVFCLVAGPKVAL